MKRASLIALLAVILSALMLLAAGNALSADVKPGQLYSPVYDDQHPNYPLYPLWTVRCEEKGKPADNGLYEYNGCSVDANAL